MENRGDGRLVPASFVEDVERHLRSANPFRPTIPVRPVSRWTRVRWRVAELRRRLRNARAALSGGWEADDR